MKNNCITLIKKSLKSKEYWWVLVLITLSAALTYIDNMHTSIGEINIGAAEFFIVCILYGNNLLQISVPIIPIFISIHSSGVFINLTFSSRTELREEMKNRIISTIIVSISFFIILYFLIIMMGYIIYGKSTQEFYCLLGPFQSIYYENPFLFLLICTAYSGLFSIAYCLLGLGIGYNLRQNKSLVLYIPLLYYFCYKNIIRIFPDWINSILYRAVPFLTFDIGLINSSLMRCLTEISIILVVGVLLLIIFYERQKKKINALSTT